MSQWLTQRNELYRVMITNGITRLEEIEAAFPLGYSVPQQKIEKWFARLLKTPKDFSEQRRYVNRFKIGADPEFVFQGEIKVPSYDEATPQARERIASQLVRVDASQLKLKQGPAFGADNNGRLAEIRPHPSRSALEVVASVLSTLRWMAILYPSTLKLQWVSGAFLHEDGIGGHVHFGRKRPTRKEEIAALDSIEELLVGLNTFPTAEVRRRRQGDAHGNHPYGQLGDYRLQTHGYEYRTWPSWLDSPELAFITLTLSKLAVHDPELLKYRAARTLDQQYQQIRNLLAYYKDVDDDARLALLIVQRRFPKHQGGDFKGRWGLGKIEALPKSSHIKIIPPSIMSDAQDDAEVFAALYLDNPLGFRVPTPSWKPIAPPSGYDMVIDWSNTIHQKGLGEMIWDICCAKEHPINFAGGANGGNSPALAIPRSMWMSLPTSERNKHRLLEAYNSDKKNEIAVSGMTRENAQVCSKVKDWLLQGYLPLWRVKDVTEDSYQQWKTHARPSIKTKHFEGKILFSDNPAYNETKNDTSS